MNWIALLVVLVAAIGSCIKIITTYERGVVFFLGKVRPEPLREGVRLVFPGIYVLRRIDTRIVPIDVPSQDIITKDNVSVKVNAVVYYRVIDANKAVIETENYHYATSLLAQTTLRSVCGEKTLDDLLAEREAINLRLQEILDQATHGWGVKVSMVEIKNVDLPLDMQRAMAKQAEAERDRRAKVIAAQGEYEAAEKLSMAAERISHQPLAMQLRYLQTLREISGQGGNSTIIPFPVELMKIVGKMVE